MIALWIYIGMTLTWGGIAGYKQWTAYSITPPWWQNVLVILLNIVIFPYAIYVAIKTNKL